MLLGERRGLRRAYSIHPKFLGSRLRVSVKLGSDLAPGSMQAAHDRALLTSERVRSVAVGQSDDVDGDDRLAQGISQSVQRSADANYRREPSRPQLWCSSRWGRRFSCWV
jgi:hypothetical protein